VWVIICPACGENIVERMDEQTITSASDAWRYWREHAAAEHGLTR
jgi:hypothetical protein